MLLLSRSKAIGIIGCIFALSSPLLLSAQSSGEESLEKLAAKQPALVRVAKVRFNKNIKPTELVELAQANGLTISELHFQVGNHSAGFRSNEGQSLKESLATASAAHAEFLQTVLSSEKQPSLLNEFKLMKKKFEEEGLPITAIRTSASLAVLKKFQNNSLIQQVELAE